MFENENLNRGIEPLEPLAAEKGVGDGKRLSLRAYSLARSRDSCSRAFW